MSNNNDKTYIFNTSGAIYPGDPQYCLSNWPGVVLIDNPKSVSFALPSSSNNIFSLWNIKYKLKTILIINIRF